MKRLIVGLWKTATYRNRPAYPPPRRPVDRQPRVEELELLMLEVDPRTRRVRIAAVRRPPGH